MNNSSLAGKIVLRMNWISICEVFNALHQAANARNRVSLVLIAGACPQLCQQLEQTWKNAESSLKQSSLAIALTLTKTPPSDTLPLAGLKPLLVRLNLAEVAASLTILSSELNVWMQLQAIDSSSTPEQWELTLTFEPDAIAQWLQRPETLAILPNLAYLEPSDLQNDRALLRRLWLQLLPLMEQQHSTATPEPQLPRPHSTFRPPSLLSDESLFSQSPYGIFWESLDGGLLRANPAFCQLLGYTEIQLRHLDARSISHPEDFAREVRAIQALLHQSSNPQIFKKRFFRRNGSVVWTEVCLSIVKASEAEEPYLLGFVTDLTDLRASERDRDEQSQREALAHQIASLVRSHLELPSILQKMVELLQTHLGADRVVAYQLLPNHSGVCLAEAVDPAYPTLQGQIFGAECLPSTYLEAYSRGRFWLATDIQALELAKCHRQMLDGIRVRSAIAAPILLSHDRLSAANTEDSPTLHPEENTLWGLLVVHQCRMPRQWTVQEQQLVQAVAERIAQAVEHAALSQQLRAYVQELEIRVAQRTQSLARSLALEKLLRQLAQLGRDRACTEKILQSVAVGLTEMFQPARVRISTYEARQQVFRPTEVTPTAPWMLDAQSLLDRPQGERLNLPEGGTEILKPIQDERGLLGAIQLYCPQSYPLEFSDLALIEQVASECAIALRQSHWQVPKSASSENANDFHLFLEKSVDVFVEYDADTDLAGNWVFRCLYLNPAGVEFLGDAAAAIGQPIRTLWRDRATEIELALKQVFHQGEQMFVSHQFVSGTLESLYIPIASPAGGVQRVLAIYRDVSESRHQWQSLQEQNHQLTVVNRLKEEFIATTSHELRTPLTAIMGFSSVLLTETFGSLNSKQRDYLERINGSGKHLLELINDILDLSRIEANRLELEPQLVFIQEICESIVGLLQERAGSQGIALEIEIDPTLEYMVTDPKRLRQILLNLLSNAVKFTPNGSVGLKVYRSSEGQNPRVANWVHFLVWDTGIGISPANQHLLFSPFSQIDSSLSRKHQGTGLGLAIARKLAELQGGTIALESCLGEGSRFTLSLPSPANPALA
ncbi:MAG: ATP-binding protein [Desertifilum sp.]|nr:ATP-binding protein [Desertifilum sp.]